MTELRWDFPGARWWKLDCHTHTPASDDYGKGQQQSQLRQRAPKEWLLDYMQCGIDCVVVTDHNTGSWVDVLKEALTELEVERPGGYRPLYLFPGVEISVYGGVHLLAILDPTKTTSDVDSLLGAVGFAGTKGRSDDVTTKSFTEVVRAVNEAGGIAVPAHVDGPNGLFGQQGTTLAQALSCGDIFAMEVVTAAMPEPPAYREKKLHWTKVLGSDAHHPTGMAGPRFPGSHFTWVKMGTPSLDGLRLALLDGPLSVRRSDEVSGDPNARTTFAIESIEVSRARYMGRAETFTLRLSPWLNAIIGGRGTGKSTLLEFLRRVFRRENELPPALKGESEKYGKVYERRADDGLLTNESRFTVTCRKDRTRYRLQWSPLNDVTPIEVQDALGEWRADQGDVAQRFPVRVYSQKQIFELAKAPLALLLIVDEAPEVDKRNWEESWKEEEARFLSLRAKAREIEAGLSDEPRLRGELEDILRKLAIFEEAGHAGVLKEYQQRLRQQAALDAWEETWFRAGKDLRELSESLVPAPLEPLAFPGPEDVSIKEAASRALDDLQLVSQRLKDIAAGAEETHARWRQDREQSSWQQAVESAVKEYQDLRQRLEAGAAGDPKAFGDLVQRRQALEARLIELGSRREQLDSMRSDAEASLNQLALQRQELTTKRHAFLTNILADNPYVRIDVVPYGDHDTTPTALRGLLHREDSAFEKDIDTLLKELYTTSTDAQTIEASLKALKTKLRAIGGGSYGAALADRRFATHMEKLPPEALDRIDVWFPEDSLKVEYRTGTDGSGFRPIQEGSPGQKTAALLAFLFSYGEEPIILDQPEDDLDNNLIYDLIVGQLRQIKQKRQLIIVSHNANIVVNGDAELVVSLGARGGETQKDCVGCLQERDMRESICLVMEGGQEAFQRRWHRLGKAT